MMRYHAVLKYCLENHERAAGLIGPPAPPEEQPRARMRMGETFEAFAKVTPANGVLWLQKTIGLT